MDSTVNLWDLGSQKKAVLADDSRGAVFCTVFFGNDKKIMIGRAFGSVVVFDVKTARREVVIQVHSAGIKGIVVRKDGRFAIAGGGEARNPITGKKQWGSVWVIDIERKKVLHTYKTKSPVTTICETIDGKQLIVGERDGTLSVLEFVK